MKVVLKTESTLTAVRLKEKLIGSVSGRIEGVKIETWAYTHSSDDYDIIFHNADQYISDPSKNVIYRVEVENANVVLSLAWWSNNPAPTHDLFSIHTGRLIEMIIRYFSENIIGISIVNL